MAWCAELFHEQTYFSGYLIISRGRHNFFVELVLEFELFSFRCSSFNSFVVLLNLCGALLLSSVVF